MMNLSDRLNPILIKELRQMVRSNFANGLLMGILLFNFAIVSLTFWTLERETLGQDGGRRIFQIVSVTTFGLSLLLVPFYCGLRFYAERNHANLDLLFTTALRPAQIVWGKWLSGAVVSLMFFTTQLPFLSFCYLLGGLDFKVVFLFFWGGLGTVLLVNQIFLCAAAFEMRRVYRAVLAILLFFAVVALFVWFSIMVSIFTWGYEVLGSGFLHFWLPLLAGFVFFAAAIGQLGIFTEAMILPPSANRIRWVRLSMSLVWLVSLGITIAIVMIRGDRDAFNAWLVCSLFFVGLAWLISISERVHPGARVMRSLPPSGMGRRFSFFFCSGRAGGISWSFGLALITALTPFLLREGVGFSWMRRFNNADMITVAGLVAFGLGLGFAALHLSRLRFFQARMFPIWVLALLLIGFDTLLPFLVYFLSGADGSMENAPVFQIVRIVSPVGLFYSSRFMAFMSALILLFVGMLLYLPEWWRGYKAIVEAPDPKPDSDPKMVGEEG